MVHGACDGAKVIGGTMTNGSVRRNASGIYVSPGTTGNNNITIGGVKVTGTGAPGPRHDASDCTVRSCDVRHLRKIPRSR